MISSCQMNPKKSQQIVLFVGALITSFLGGLFLLKGDFVYGSYDTMAFFAGFNDYGWIGIDHAIEFALEQALERGNPFLLILLALLKNKQFSYPS